MAIAAFIPLIATVLDKIFPDESKAAEAKLKVMQLFQEGDIELTQQAGAIITAEANSEHWIVAAWRPVTMLVFVAIIANNYMVYPYLSLFWADAPILTLPPDLWDLLKIGLGGYVVGRSTEKAVKAYKA